MTTTMTTSVPFKNWEEYRPSFELALNSAFGMEDDADAGWTREQVERDIQYRKYEVDDVYIIKHLIENGNSLQEGVDMIIDVLREARYFKHFHDRYDIVRVLKMFKGAKYSVFPINE
jgi:hypothetical protein